MRDYTIDALQKGARVIEALCRYHRPMTLKEVSHFTKLGKNAVFRILHTLHGVHFVECYGDQWSISAHLCLLIDRTVESKLQWLDKLRRFRDAQKPDAEGAGEGEPGETEDH